MQQLMHRREFLLAAATCLAYLKLARAAVAVGVKPEQIGSNLPFPGQDLETALRTLRDLGFDAVEPPMAHSFAPPPPNAAVVPLGEVDERWQQRVRKALKPFKHRSVHLPFARLALVGTDQDLVQRSRRIMEASLERAALLEVEFANIHCIAPRGVSLEKAWNELLDLYRHYGDRAQALGFRIGIETGYPRSVAEFVRFVREVDHPNVGATIDVGHQIHYPEFRQRFGRTIPNSPEAYKAYNDVLEQLVDELGEKLWHFHIHDIDPAIWREHKPLRYGVIDYTRLFRKLAQTGFNGLLIFEIAVLRGEDMVEVMREARNKVLGYLKA